jgi:hypothetical protein
VRFWIESRTRFIDDDRGIVEDYYQCASCKSEDTFATKDLFQADNFDFLPIFGPELGVIFRRKAWLNPNYKTIKPANEMWEGALYDGVRYPPVVLDLDEYSLEEPQAIANATHAYAPIVAQVEIRNDQTRQRVILEHPVKTMNINREQGMFQTDTGPLAFIDLTERVERAVDAMSLAFCAFNARHFADFVVEEPTQLEGGAKVYHYSRRVSLPSVNRLFSH